MPALWRRLARFERWPRRVAAAQDLALGRVAELVSGFLFRVKMHCCCLVHRQWRWLVCALEFFQLGDGKLFALGDPRLQCGQVVAVLREIKTCAESGICANCVQKRHSAPQHSVE